jgi:glucuronate isomerase
MRNSKEFINDNFLLENEVSRSLFHTVAKDLPIIDYHNHIDPLHLAQDKTFDNIAELWVTGDPYKHRAMRINGIAEKDITGSTTDQERFRFWAKTVPKTLGNPLFHWSCLELKRVFGIDEILTESSARRIWDMCNSQLQKKDFTAAQIMKGWNVEALCTSDDWFQDLSVHKEASLKTGFSVLPSLRADAALNFSSWNTTDFLDKLSEITNITISQLEDFQRALVDRLEYFGNNGCRLSDHALNAGFVFEICPEDKAKKLFRSVLDGIQLSTREDVQLQSFILGFLGKEYDKLGWTMQLHIGAQRNTSSRLQKLAGGAGGYAGIGKTADIASICSFFDFLEKGGGLPGIILYTLNPNDNEAFATLTGSFSEDGKPGKIQFGPAWWYNDHFNGIENQLLTISNYGLLSRFIGMTTDSRSLLSFSRHEYFRRIACNMIGKWVERGHLPKDDGLLTELIKNISYTNSKNLILDGA